MLTLAFCVDHVHETRKLLKLFGARRPPICQNCVDDAVVEASSKHAIGCTSQAKVCDSLDAENRRHSARKLLESGGVESLHYHAVCEPAEQMLVKNATPLRVQLVPQSVHIAEDYDRRVKVAVINVALGLGVQKLEKAVRPIRLLENLQTRARK